jgi:hypothetical protein
MKHLRVLADAGLVVTRKSGRAKRHFRNPVPIRLIHNRRMDKYAPRPDVEGDHATGGRPLDGRAPAWIRSGDHPAAKPTTPPVVRPPYR